MAGVNLNVGNIPITFPYKPYASQLSMMSRVIEALDKKKNCLLESPTGTGKTLTLLCASLAWLKDKKKIDSTLDLQNSCSTCYSKDMQFDDSALEKVANKPAETGPKIYYCTRTHKQITQIIRELKKTVYCDSKMSILSSRKHTCINPEVQASSNLTDACQNLITSGFCSYDQPRKKSDFTRAMNRLDHMGPWDIEDLVEILSKVPSCPYYTSRKLAKSADIIFCPYDYLLDPLNRAATSIEITNNVIIFDEAHNIEDASREAASFTITQNQLNSAKEDLERISKANIEPESCAALIKMTEGILHVMELTLSRLVRVGETAQPTQVWTGREICGLMGTVGLGPENLGDLNHAYKKLSSFSLDDDNDGRPHNLHNSNRDQHQPKPALKTLHFLEALFTVLNYMFKGDMCHLSDYRVVLVETITYEKQYSNEDKNDLNSPHSSWLSKNRTKSRIVECRELSLNFWCLNPAVIFSELVSSVHCVILMSGTLSPMEALEAEMGVPFPIRLEANHVVSSDRLFVSALSHGPNGVRLCANYQNQNTFTFQDELGALVLHACRIVPSGVLCFLPSYNLLDKLVQRWEVTGLLSDLQVIKHVMIEPRSSVGLDSWLEEFYAAIDEFSLPGRHHSTLKSCKIDRSNTDSSLKTSLMSDQSPKKMSKTGAIVFAVCRGKVSEGLDFADSYARLVISVGIPYPAFTNPQVQQKREFNDAVYKSQTIQQIHSQRRLSEIMHSATQNLNCQSEDQVTLNLSTSSNAVKRRMLNGSEWYDAQAYRALNQALGRCIRHANDWGAVILIDSRFVEQPKRYMTGISRWIRSRATHHNLWENLKNDLQKFFAVREDCAKVEKAVEDLNDIFSS